IMSVPRRDSSEGMTLDNAFVELRPSMFALAYRITGNRADAEEIVQDAFVRLHDAELNDAIRSLKSYLATIIARLSLNRLRDQRARRETYIGEWLPEPLATEGSLQCEPKTYHLRCSPCSSASLLRSAWCSYCGMPLI